MWWQQRHFPFLAELIYSAYIQQHGGDEGYHQRTEQGDMLFALLDRPNEKQEIISASQLRDGFPPCMQVVVSRYIEPNVSRFVKHTVAQELEQIFPEGFSVINKGYMCILTGKITSAQRKMLQEMIVREDIVVGESWEFEDLSEFESHYRQGACVKLVERRGARNLYIEYDECVTYHLIARYKGELLLSNFRHPALKKLREYDNDNASSLYNTLDFYSKNNLSTQHTADALFIHRNTLMYR